MKELTKKYIEITLREEKLWKVGESDTFNFKNWELTLRKEEEVYRPFIFSINGKNDNGSHWCRRYKSMKNAFLHVVNGFNENSNIKNEYQSIDDFIISE